MTAISERRFERLFAPVDAASGAVFRIAFGILMLIATLRFFTNGWISEYYEMPKHHFTYYGFAWVKALPAPGMYIHFGAMAVLAVMIIVGWRYRLAVALYGIAFTYVHLIDKSHYLNHYYLVSCLCVLMAFLPLHRMWSLDARRDPTVRGSTVPAWVVWALRAQIGLVYLFGGIAKLNHDWLVDAQPLTIWLSANTDFPIIGSLFDDPITAYVFSYAGLVFDLTIVPLLLWRRSRPFAYLAVIAFHLITAKLFMLGMFPWIMMASSLVFLPPSWPRRFVTANAVESTLKPVDHRRRRLVAGLLGAYFALHLLIPLRHWLYPDDRAWSEEGFRFSWNVMVMEKDGSLELRVREPATGRRWEVTPSKYLTRYQAKMAASQPDMILELAHVVADDFRARGVVDPEVRVDAFVSLNGRRRARLIDPDVDLAARSDGLGPRPWILPEPENTP